MSKSAIPSLARRCLTTSSTVKEASEALRHVEESEKLKIPMIDRTRVWTLGLFL